MSTLAGYMMADCDASLVDRCLTNDPNAFDEVVDRYHRRIYHYVKRMVKDDTTAEDLTQDTFVKAYLHISKFRQQSSLQTWLFSIATNVVRDHIRKCSRRPSIFSLWSSGIQNEDDQQIDIPDVSNTPELNLLLSEQSDTINELINALPERMRQVLILCDLEEFTQVEVAGMLNVPSGTVKSRLFHARAKLRIGLQPYLEGRSLREVTSS